MAKKQPEALYGYDGQEPTYTLADGRELSAGDLVEQAAARYHAANPGLDTSQLGMAWNNLEDARRRDWCEHTLEAMNAELETGAAQVDAVNVVATVAPKAEKQLGAALIDAAMTEVRNLKRPWVEMSEDDQDEVLERLTKRTKTAVRETIQILATRGVHHVMAELEQITVKKEAKAILVLPRGSMDQDLLDAIGQPVFLVVGGNFSAVEEIEKPAPDPQQPDLLSQTISAPNVSQDGNGGGEPDAGGVVHSDPAD